MESKKKKRLFIHMGDIRIAPDQRIRTDKQPNKPDGRTNHFPERSVFGD